MKKLFVLIISMMFLFNMPTYAGEDDKKTTREEIICSCGCMYIAVVCGCATAIRDLELFDKRQKDKYKRINTKR